MIYKRLTDKDLILSILLDSEITETTRIDSVDISIDVEKDCFLGCFVDNNLIGIAVFDADNTVCVNYHPNLLKKYRGKLSVPFTIGALKWLVKNASMYRKVNSKFPVCYNGLDKYAEKCGFTKEGLDRDSCKLGDRYCYGITKKEIEQL